MSKKQDYERVSGAIRETRERMIARLQRTAPGVNADWVNQFAGDLALLLAQRFHSVNERFKVEQFLSDALGEHQGIAAYQEFQTNQDARKQAQQQ